MEARSLGQRQVGPSDVVGGFVIVQLAAGFFGLAEDVLRLFLHGSTLIVAAIGSDGVEQVSAVGRLGVVERRFSE